MVRKTAYIWILSPLALLWPASAVAVGQDVTSSSPVAMTCATDEPTPADGKVPAAPDAKTPETPMAPAAAAPAPAADSGAACACNGGGEDCCKLTCPDQTVKRLAKEGVKSIAVITPGFSADCLETLEEIAFENADIFKHNGGENFAAVPCLNDSAPGMEVIRRLAEREPEGWV